MKLYIIVRSDLAPGLQLAQSCHAAQAFMVEHGAAATDWLATSGNLVVLHAADESELVEIADRARGIGLIMSAFREPDLGDQLTAIAVQGEAAKKLTQRMRLAFAA